MKAWLVREKDEFGTTVVFAETRGKARAMALSTECCEGADFCNIEVSRLPKADKYYKKGKTEMEWDDPKDRIALVKNFGFYCEIPQECDVCPAKEYCEERDINA